MWWWDGHFVTEMTTANTCIDATAAANTDKSRGKSLEFLAHLTIKEIAQYGLLS